MSAHPLRQSDCGLSEPVILKICEVFKRYPQVEKAVLYGSRAKAAHKTGSDIDLTLHGGNRPDPERPAPHRGRIGRPVSALYIRPLHLPRHHRPRRNRAYSARWCNNV